MLAFCSADRTTILTDVYLKCEHLLFHLYTYNGRQIVITAMWLFLELGDCLMKNWTIMFAWLYWKKKNVIVRKVENRLSTLI
jgi:hypothetical protein